MSELFTAPPGTPPPNVATEDEDGTLRLYTVDGDGVTAWTRRGRFLICRDCKEGDHEGTPCPGYLMDPQKDMVVRCECTHPGHR